MKISEDPQIKYSTVLGVVALVFLIVMWFFFERG